MTSDAALEAAAERDGERSATFVDVGLRRRVDVRVGALVEKNGEGLELAARGGAVDEGPAAREVIDREAGVEEPPEVADIPPVGRDVRHRHAPGAGTPRPLE